MKPKAVKDAEIKDSAPEPESGLGASAQKRQADAERDSIAGGRKTSVNKTATKKTSNKKAAAKNTSASKTSTSKTAAEKKPSKKTAKKKAATSKATVKKTASKKKAAKKTSAKKSIAKKKSASTAATRTTAGGRTSAGKTTAKKVLAKKASAKKAPAKKKVVSKTTARKKAAKKTTARKKASTSTASVKKTSANKTTTGKTTAAKASANGNTNSKNTDQKPLVSSTQLETAPVAENKTVKDQTDTDLLYIKQANTTQANSNQTNLDQTREAQPGKTQADRTQASKTHLDETQAWRLVRGNALLVLTEQKPKHAPRHHRLLEINAGEVFFFMQPRHAGFSIAIFERDECEIVSAGLMTQVLASQEAEHWLNRVMAVVAERCPLPESEIVFPVAAREALRATEIFTPRFGAEQTAGGWVALYHGEICLAGEEQAAVAADEGTVWLPVNESFYFGATLDSEISLQSTAEVPATKRQYGLKWLFDSLVVLQQAVDRHKANANATVGSTRKIDEKLSLQASLDSLMSGRPLGSVAAVQQETPLAYALSELGKRSGVSFVYPDQLDKNAPLEQQLELISEYSGTRVRRIQLPGDWQHSDYQDLLGVTRDSKTPIAVVREPGALSGASYQMRLPPGSDSTRSISDSNSPAASERSACDILSPYLDSTAYTFTVPLDESSPRKFNGFFKNLLYKHRGDLLRIGLLSLLGMGLGFYIPLVSGVLMNEVIPSGARASLLNLVGVFVGIILITLALNYVKSLYLVRVQTLLNWRLQEAIMNRLLQLPVKFINRYSSGDLQNRVMLISSIATELYTAVFTLLMNCFNLLMFIFLCYWFLPELGWIALVTVIAFFILAGLQVYFSYRPAVELEEKEGRIFGFSHQMISGLPKLRMADAQRRALRVWCDKFSEIMQRKRKLLLLADIDDIVTPVITYGGSLLVMAAAGALILNSGEPRAAINIGAYFAFYFSYQALVSTGKQLTNTVTSLAVLWFKRSLVLPILNEPLETSASRTEAAVLSGKIDLQNIAFRYDGGPAVLEDINLSIRPGQFIGIVGPSGAGKSTLLRLLLGFEDPADGCIKYDGQDLSSLNLQSVRRQLGVVMQNNTVPAGSIAEIIAGNSQITIDDLWAAAEVAHIAADIDSMPMKMNTVMNHGAPTLSGGQRQRLLIARAIATRRRILIFDESTSALDNVSQRVVAENLERFNITRIVIAHRLSTVRNADKICVLEHGRFVQQGRYTDLCESDGLFRHLALRQAADY